MLIVIALLVLAIVVAIVLPMSQNAAKEKQLDPFVGFSGIDSIDSAARDKYINIGQQRYNKFSDTNDVTRGNFLGADTDAEIENGDEEIQAATRTSFLTADPESPTYLGLDSEATRYRLPPKSAVMLASKKCEAAKGRGSCTKLGDSDFSNCGVCLKEGTAYSDSDSAGKFIGGLLILPDDRKMAEEEARASKRPAEYEPTVGSCPPGYFFVDRAECEKAANRLDCKEAGVSGGFNGGKTIEGNQVVDAKCAQVPVAGSDVFIYDPKNRTFSMNLRVVTPTGTGVCRVYVMNSAGEQVGYGTSSNPGIEFTVPIRNVKEGQELSVTVVEEVAYRPFGKNEVFQYQANLNGTRETNYAMTRETAKSACERIGARQATEAELQKAFESGAQLCSSGWTSTSAKFPMQGYNKNTGCGSGAGLMPWNVDGKANAWCYGTKPPQNTNNFFYTYIYPWFNKMSNMVPSQDDVPSQWSQHGNDYQAPYYRAIAMQWESTDGRRRVPFEPTIQSMNGMPQDSAGNIKILRRLGTFAKSSIIASPRPTASSKMLTNMFWFWSNQAQSQQFTVKTMIPGTFLNPVYSEDMAVAPAGSLITKPETMRLLKTSPCLAADQKPGAYGIECLSNLFVGAGGDLYQGTLAREGLEKLNAYGDMDSISGYLMNLYTLATKGKKEGGMRGTVTEINDAAQKLFGFDIVTPCEDIYEDEKGNIALQPKVGAVDVDCLDYLWKNTGNDRSRGDEDTSRNTTVKNTYTTIADRYSGLRSGEGSAALRKTSPFAACQTGGSMAPIDSIGRVNMTAVATANAKGSIDMIQRFYDGIHKAANYTGANKDLAGVHTTAVDQCYGVKRAASAAGASCTTTRNNWQIVPGISCPMRIDPVSGNVQCLSYDARNCQWGTTDLSQIRINEVRPLSCGEDHKRVWGGTGYDSPTHWCNTVKNSLK